MEEYLDWERSISSFPWSSIAIMNHHHQHETQENIFLNPIPFDTTAATGPQFTPAIRDSNQYWSQPLAVNGLHEGKIVIPSITAAPSNSNAYTSPQYNEDATSVIFSDNMRLRGKIIKNLNSVSSDDVILSQSSSETNPNNISGFYELIAPRPKRSRSDPIRSTSSAISFRQSEESDVFGQLKEMIYTAAAFRPVSFADNEEVKVVEKRRRKNVRISSDPQTVAARKRRERVSERIRVLQSLVPGGNRMDTASILDEAANYLKFLRSQVKALEQFGDYVSFGTTTDAYSTTTDNTVGVPLHADSFFTVT